MLNNIGIKLMNIAKKYYKSAMEYRLFNKNIIKHINKLDKEIDKIMKQFNKK